jgi:predicted nucleic acid-binding Zn ribbon protein
MTTWRPAPQAGELREPLPVAASLDRVSRALGAAPAQVLGAVFSQWEQLVGPEIAAHARPASLRGGVLVVVVDQPAWAAQLRFMATDLLTRVRAEAEAPDIVRLEVRTAGPGAAPGRSGRGR